MGILSSFFGGDQRRDIRNASKQANAELDKAYTGADAQYDEAFDLLSPYEQRGNQANEAYTNALLGSPEQRAALFQSYSNDPAMKGVLEQQSNALLRKYNASGSGTGGGRLALAGTRVGLENWNNYLDKVGNLGQQGFQAANNQGNIRVGQGDLQWGYGATKAGNAINTGNAVSATRGIGINNLLGAVGTAAKAYTAFSDVRLKRNVTRIGALPSGLPTYLFQYNWSDQPHHGVLAHEAAAVFPAAVSEDITGFLVVDYSKIG